MQGRKLSLFRQNLRKMFAGVWLSPILPKAGWNRSSLRAAQLSNTKRSADWRWRCDLEQHDELHAGEVVIFDCPRRANFQVSFPPMFKPACIISKPNL
jgi:hypothetical protein